MSVIDRLAEENAYHLRLWDFSPVHFNWSMDEIRQVAEYGKARFPEENRLAIVANKDVAYGLFRAFQVFREQEGHSVPAVFREKNEALSWLEKQRECLDHLPPNR